MMSDSVLIETFTDLFKNLISFIIIMLNYIPKVFKSFNFQNDSSRCVYYPHIKKKP